MCLQTGIEALMAVRGGSLGRERETVRLLLWPLQCNVCQSLGFQLPVAEDQGGYWWSIVSRGQEWAGSGLTE